MRLREVTRLFEGIEKVSVVVGKGGGERQVTVVRNPTAQQVSHFLARWDDRARFFIDTEGAFFMWDARKAIHANLYIALGIARVNCAGFVYPGELALRYDEETVQRIAPKIRANPNIRAAFGPDIAIENTDDDW